MGDDVPLVGMVPEPAHVFDQLTRMVHQRIVDSNHASQAVTRLGIMLPPLQASVVERLDVPCHLIQPTVQTGLVGGDHKLAVDPPDGFLSAIISPVRYSAKWRRSGSLANRSPKISTASFTTVGKSTMVGIEAASVWL